MSNLQNKRAVVARTASQHKSSPNVDSTRAGAPRAGRTATSDSTRSQPVEAIAAIMAGGGALMFQGTVHAFLITTTFAALGALLGRPRIVLFCLGLTILFMNVPGISLLGPPITFGAILVCSTLRSARSIRLTARPLALLLTLALSSTYLFASPPSTGAGTAAAFALLSIPLGLLTLESLRFSFAKTPDGAIWAAAGLATATGLGLWQSLQAVLTSETKYEHTRIFESVIGSSNAASAISVVVGILLLSIAASHDKGRLRPLLVAASAPFLAAPVVLASRGSLLALLVGVTVIALTNSKARQAVLPLRIVSLAAILFALGFAARSQQWFLWRRLVQGFAGQDVTSGRDELLDWSIHSIITHPFTGLGIGKFNEELYETFSIAYSHNFITDIFGQVGLILGLMYLTAIMPRKIRESRATAPAVATLIVASLVEPLMTTPGGAMVFISLLAAHEIGRSNYATPQPQGA